MTTCNQTCLSHEVHVLFISEIICQPGLQQVASHCSEFPLAFLHRSDWKGLLLLPFLTDCLRLEVYPHFQAQFVGRINRLGDTVPELTSCLPISIFNLDMIQFLRLNTCATHHFKAGSSTIPLATAYLAISTGLEIL